MENVTSYCNGLKVVAVDRNHHHYPGLPRPLVMMGPGGDSAHLLQCGDSGSPPPTVDGGTR